MATKGSVAKDNVMRIIQNAFGNNFVGLIDKKIYVWADDGENGKTQIALSLTCPKAQAINTNNLDVGQSGIDFTSGETVSVKPVATELKPEERKNIQELIDKLGL